ncbi:uncharacterized protein LAESUDRAFT_731732 [Laetiporus sulphureus 93-53]|uniref:Uncharacterized protein n=1 Tax=Laetiporus sulphureus 93-53 TaxID=1314785 RepID=A0A165BGA2_9APHY|nr:uncharacterized protein LAESUDRAFT_731732 [Laetiporus sulphureus 93-53]KZT01002.1 hypothetical protein LAESUDRAFT_731732 [Laetiporus sulphureus 93-53]
MHFVAFIISTVQPSNGLKNRKGRGAYGNRGNRCPGVDHTGSCRINGRRYAREFEGSRGRASSRKGICARDLRTVKTKCSECAIQSIITAYEAGCTKETSRVHRLSYLRPQLRVL